MKVILFDTPNRAQLFPLALTRAVADLRVGILTIKERWQRLLNAEVYVLTEEYLQRMYNDIPEGEYLFIEAAVVPDAQLAQTFLALHNEQALTDSVGLIAGKAVYNSSVSIPNLHTLFKGSQTSDNIRRFDSCFKLVQLNEEMIKLDYSLLAHKRRSVDLNETVQEIGSARIFVEEGTDVHFSILNASNGPIYIGRNAVVMEGCIIRGPFALGEGAVLKMGTKVYGASTIGPYCTAGGEIKNSIMTGYSNKAHDGYLGDSVIGEWCNLGAGTTTSNVKNTGGEIKLWSYDKQDFVSAGNKCGVIMGDYSKTAINTAINSGTVIGICCNVFGEGLTAKLIKDFSWGFKGETYRLEKAVADINNWKAFKNSTVQQAELNILEHLYNVLQ